ncbi:MAG: YggS family pyridoxal phosphate-dependent enzyme [Burkholderiaceae bacterium]|jgi:pyridoxal phosphate enzyme (YggS family)|nr:YggS family pyridoxal phosphate-dependent enzyme [Burkholderiaceae bacterium]
MATIATHLQSVRARIVAACAQAGRDASQVTLLAVSKTQPADAVRAAYDAGQRAFGENYVQEGVEKIAALADLPGIQWHCIGPLQGNKTRPVAEHFDWVHSLDRLKIAERLSAQRPAGKPLLNVCIQVNIDGGASKSGVAPADALALAQAVNALPNLRLRGIMTIPDPASEAQMRAWHVRARALFDTLRQAGLPLDTLSMGMSADLEAAIAEGTTLVRVGTAIFGARPPKEAAPISAPV